MIAGRIAALLGPWRATRWVVRHGVSWRPLPARSALPVVAVSAMNPGARRLSGAANRSRDLQLRRAVPSGALRVRGHGPGWSEDGWLVPLGAATPMLRRWGQLAGLRLDAGGSALAWRHGGMRRLPRQAMRSAS